MLSEIKYITFFNYSPRGLEDISVMSRKFVGAIKAGRKEVIDWAIDKIIKEGTDLSQFLNAETTLVPVPRSSLVVEGGVWPPKLIAESIFEKGLVKDVKYYLSRNNPVRKSSSNFDSATRPSVQEHYESLNVSLDLLPSTQLTLVDDVLTLGRTTFACAQKLHDVYPNADIRCLIFVRTQGLIPNIEKFIDPDIGDIFYNVNSGKTTRKP